MVGSGASAATAPRLASEKNAAVRNFCMAYLDGENHMVVQSLSDGGTIGPPDECDAKAN
jgi:hypothetical protein